MMTLLAIKRITHFAAPFWIPWLTSNPGSLVTKLSRIIMRLAKDAFRPCRGEFCDFSAAVLQALT